MKGAVLKAEISLE